MTKKYQYKGKTYNSLEQLVKATGSTVDAHNVYQRVHSYGWPLEKALTQKVNQYKPRTKSKVKPVVTSGTISRRRKVYGWDYDKAASTKNMKMLSPEESEESRKKSRKKYAKKNPDMIRRNQSLTFARNFIREYAGNAELAAAEKIIKEKLAGKKEVSQLNADLKDPNFAKTEHENKMYVAKRVYFNRFIRQYADDAYGKRGLESLQKLINLRHQVGRRFNYQEQKQNNW